MLQGSLVWSIIWRSMAVVDHLGAGFSMKQLNDSLCDSPSPRAVGPSVSHSGRAQSYRWSGIRNSTQILRACPTAKSSLAAPAKSENASPLMPVLIMGVVLVRQSEATALPKVRNGSRVFFFGQAIQEMVTRLPSNSA